MLLFGLPYYVGAVAFQRALGLRVVNLRMKKLSGDAFQISILLIFALKAVAARNTQSTAADKSERWGRK